MSPERTRRAVLRGLGGLAALSTVSVQAAAAEGDEYTTTEFTAASFDGTELAGTLYVPEGTDPHPVVLGTHGWGGDHTSAAIQRRADTYAANGYVYCAYDSRGFGESGGEVGVDGPNEVADALTLLDQLAKGEVGGVPLSIETDDNGPVCAMDGLSYAGGIQLNTMAVSTPEAARELLPDGASFATIDFSQGSPLDAAVPRWAWHDLVFSLAPRGIVKNGWDSLLVAVGVAGARGLTSGDGQPSMADVTNGVTPAVPEAFLRATATNEFSESDREFYRARSPASKTELLDTPSLFISGWNDTLFVPNEALWNRSAVADNGVESKLLLFQGGHTFGETASDEVNAHLDSRALEFVDAHLKRGQGRSSLPAVEYYRTQTDEFVTRPDIPAPGAGELELPLSEGGQGDVTVVANSVAPTSASQVFVQGKGDYAEGATSLSYDFDVDEETELLGVPELDLVVEPLGDEARLFVKVEHVEDGTATLVHNQVTPVAVQGVAETQRVEVEMTAIQRNLSAGDTLRLTVASTDAGFSGSRSAAGARLYHASETESLVRFPTTPN